MDISKHHLHKQNKFCMNSHGRFSKKKGCRKLFLTKKFVKLLTRQIIDLPIKVVLYMYVEKIHNKINRNT